MYVYVYKYKLQVSYTLYHALFLMFVVGSIWSAYKNT